MNWLYVKSLLIRTPLEEPAQRLRDFTGILRRLRYPELHDIYMEQNRIDQAMRKIIQSDVNCIDIGCHIGSSLSLMLRLSPRGRHIAFEPVQEKAEWLRRKFPEVEIMALALGDKRERRAFFQDASHPGFSGFASHPGFSGSAKHSATRDEVIEQTVDCETLDNVVGADRKYTFVKIDVEGAELSVLKGARQLIARDTPIILFESSHDGAMRLGFKRDDLFTFFVDELGYKVFLVKDFLEKRAALDLTGFQRAAVYPFQAFNFLAIPNAITH
ncbi:MAG: FkbM family methyltransferase [Terracidiphilus sp.]